MNKSGYAISLSSLLILSACANGQSTLEGFDDQPTKIGLAIVDNRPKTDKESEILSLSVASCDYAIRRLGDETTTPSWLMLLRHDLEDTLGSKIANVSVEVDRYTVYWDAKASVYASIKYGSAPSLNGSSPSILDKLTLDAPCTKEETGEAWADPTPEMVHSAPLVVIAEVSIGGRKFQTNTVHVPANGFRVTEASPDMFTALRKANLALAQQIGSTLNNP